MVRDFHSRRLGPGTWGSGQMNQQLVYFFATVAATIAITFWAARRNSGRASYYAAEGRISAPQNGLAIAGDFLSAGRSESVVEGKSVSVRVVIGGRRIIKKKKK